MLSSLLGVQRRFGGSLTVMVLGLLAAFVLGWRQSGLSGGWSSILICLSLALLEISLSFDNAVVNASVLGRMTPAWRKRFLFWGWLIAVVVIRLILPIAIVSILAHLSPLEAFLLAATQPRDYAAVMASVHVAVGGFGGAFLLMVALTYFANPQKSRHWVPFLESRMTVISRSLTYVCVAGLIALCALIMKSPGDARSFASSGFWGLASFFALDSFSRWMERRGKAAFTRHSVSTSAALFLYLEVLDASFSFDGVVGAFAITDDLFIITIGLGIGAMFVRSLTLLLVKRGILMRFVYLEHGAFYATAALGTVMFVGIFVAVPEVLTALLGVALIFLALMSSIRHERREKRRR